MSPLLRIFEVALVALATILVLGTTASAQEETDEKLNGCLIKIRGQIYDARPCDMNSDSGSQIYFGHLDEQKSEGYWVYIRVHDMETIDAYWNEEYGASRAHARLGLVQTVESTVGECFSGDDVLLCFNIPPATPIYYVEDRPNEEQDRVLLAYLDGVEYQLIHPDWGNSAPVKVLEREDFDGDGREDQLVSVISRGNCCPESLSVVSYRGNGFFTFLDSSPLPSGWAGHEVVNENGQYIIRISDIPSGEGNSKRLRTERDYAFANGDMQLIAQRTEYSTVTEVASLGIDDVKYAEGGRGKLSFDINNDEIQDEVTCSYWERWGVLSCQALISGVAAPIDLQCNHVAVSPVVFGANQSHRLMCDSMMVEY